jgi:glycerol-3-phosphate dehydrogenase (NAD(P)+)
VAGGVAANQAVRRALTELAATHDLPFVAPPLWLCTDNAAMIAWAGALRFEAGLVDGLDAPARARWPLDPAAEKARGAGGEGVKAGVIGGGAWARHWPRSRPPKARRYCSGRASRGRRSDQRAPREQPVPQRRPRCPPRSAPPPTWRALGACDFYLAVAPAQHLRAVLAGLPAAGRPLVLCAKGIEDGTGLLMHEVAHEVQPDCPIAVLSGPTFAHEVAAGLPTAVTLAVEDQALGERLTTRIARPFFRPYLSDDVAGAEVGGAVKNVLAIACGVVEGAARAKRPRRPDLARLRRNDPLRPRQGRARRDAGGPCRARRSRPHLLVDQLAQLQPRQGHGEGARPADLLADRTTVAEGAFTAPVLKRAAERGRRHADRRRGRALAGGGAGGRSRSVGTACWRRRFRSEGV